MNRIEARADRRTFLQGAALTMGAAGCSLGAETRHSPALPAPRGRDGTQRISGIDPAEVVAEYRARNLAGLSDDELYRQVGAIVGRPCEGRTSFTLHAPLELYARRGLLSIVDAGDREVARMQMVASAAAYEDGTRRADPLQPAAPFSDLDAARAAFAAGFAAADGAGAERVALRIAQQFGGMALVDVVAPYALVSLTVAAHSHIGLWLFAQHGCRSGLGIEGAFLTPAIRMVAEEPDYRMRAFSELKMRDADLKLSPARIERLFLEKLAFPPRVEASRGGIRPAINAVEEAGVPEELFGELMSQRWSPDQTAAAFRAILRAAAFSMLREREDLAKFGWSHAFTLPQAACGLAGRGVLRRTALAEAIVVISGFRALWRETELDYDWQPERPEKSSRSFGEALRAGPGEAAAHAWHAGFEERGSIWRQLASEASIRNDQHLVKYTRACMDAADFDPSHLHLYQSAAAFLAGVWIAEVPRADVLKRPLDGRDTPS